MSVRPCFAELHSFLYHPCDLSSLLHHIFKGYCPEKQVDQTHRKHAFSCLPEMCFAMMNLLCSKLLPLYKVKCTPKRPWCMHEIKSCQCVDAPNLKGPPKAGQNV